MVRTRQERRNLACPFWRIPGEDVRMIGSFCEPKSFIRLAHGNRLLATTLDEDRTALKLRVENEERERAEAANSRRRERLYGLLLVSLITASAARHNTIPLGLLLGFGLQEGEEDNDDVDAISE